MPPASISISCSLPRRIPAAGPWSIPTTSPRGIERIFSENGSFYLLGFQPPASDPPGTLHRLTVRVNRPNTEVRTRSGFYTPKVEKPDPLVTPMARAVARPLPSADLPLRVELAPFMTKGSDEAAVTMVLGLRAPEATRLGSDTVEIQVSAFTPDGVARGTSQQAVVALRGSASEAPGDYEALSQIQLKPGRYELRIAAHSVASNVVGSVFADVDVPDFARQPLSMSGVLIERQPALPSAPRQAFASIVPIVPTAERTFARTDSASVFLRVYQGGRQTLSAVSFHARILDENGAARLNETTTLAREQFDPITRSVEYRLAIPLGSLTAGQYLLTFEATLDAAAATRNVRFTIK
jgi:hypothetical protein